MVLFLYISSVTNNILYSVVDESEQYAAIAFESSTVLCFFLQQNDVHAIYWPVNWDVLV